MPRIGLLAAWGRYPLLVARALKQRGYRVCCLGIRGHADAELREVCDDFRWQGIARLGSATRYFRRHGVQQATMAGKIHKVLIYRPWLWLRHMPDWQFVTTFYHHFVTGKRDRRDDTLLGAIVNAFAERGVEFAPATEFAPEVLVGERQLAVRPLSEARLRDVQFGWHLAKEMGRLDVGQSVCVKERAVLAVEAIEGTDQCILRAGSLCKIGGFTVVKVAKPQQDMRFDVPTIGVGTLQTMVKARANVLAVEAHKTIILDEPEFVDFAERHRISVVALTDPIGKR